MAVASWVPAFAQDVSEEDSIETVVVTGSRLKPSGFEAPTPVAVLDSDDLKYSGTVNVENLLSSSPQFVGAVQGGSSSNTVQANGDAGAAYTNLRGLGASRTLVLVNGRRYVVQGTSLSTDLNTIPAALIERTEVVTGGSSAVYGSDAIAGVINFIMKQNFEGVEGSAQFKFDEPTITPTYNFDLTVGGNFADNRGNVAMSINYLNRGGFTQGEYGRWAGTQYRDGCVTSSSYSHSKPGTALSGVSTGADCVAAGGKNGLITGGSSSIPNGAFYGLTSYDDADSTLQSLYDAAGLSGMSSDGFTFDDAGTTVRNRDSDSDLYNLIADNYMQMPQTRWMMNAFAHYDFTAHLTGYAEFHFSSNTVDAQLTPAGASGTLLIDTDNPYLSSEMQEVLSYLDSQETSSSTVTAGTDSYTNSPNDGLVALSYKRRLVENGDRKNSVNRHAWRFAGGLRGDLGSLDPDYLHDLGFDIYYSYSRTNEVDSQSGSISASALQEAVLSQDGADPVCNIFGQNMSDDCISAITVSSSVQTEAEMQNMVANISGSAFDLPAGSVDFVLGGEWRYTFAQYIPDQYTASGDVVGLTSADATSGNVNVHEVFGEVRVPILSDLPFIQKLSLNSAFRYSHYNLKNTGGVWTYSAGADWRMNDDFNFRGQFQHAIRAPNVNDLYGGTTTNTSSGTVDPCGASATDQSSKVKALCIATGVPESKVFTSSVQGTYDLIKYQSGGNEDLKPEKSDTITLGMVYTPSYLPDFAMSVDFYSIYIKGAISTLAGGLSGVLSSCYYTIQDEDSAYCQAIHRNSSGALSDDGYVTVGNANLGAMKTQGVDFQSQYAFDVDWGWLSETSSINITTAWTWMLEYTTTPDTSYMDEKNECAGGYGTTCGEPLPRWKGTTRVTWTDGPLSLSLRHRYIGSVTLDTYLLNVRSGTSDTKANYTNPVLPAMHYFDLSGKYTLNDHFQFSASINNFFDKDPPIVGNAASYDNTYPATYDILGRVYFFSITAKTN